MNDNVQNNNDGLDDEELDRIVGISSAHTELPSRYYNEIGRMHILKGRDHTNTKQIISWEMVKPCIGDRCRAFSLCEYGDVGWRKCKVEMMYLKTITMVLYRSFASVMDEPTMMRVGLHLMPLYQNLCRFLIAEIGVGVFETSAKGFPMVNPVYKEIREHIKLIEQTWKSLGLTEYFVEASEDGTKMDGAEVLAATKLVSVSLGKPKVTKKLVRRKRVVEPSEEEDE